MSWFGRSEGGGKNEEEVNEGDGRAALSKLDWKV
jgi:hypothetical protein